VVYRARAELREKISTNGARALAISECAATAKGARAFKCACNQAAIADRLIVLVPRRSTFIDAAHGVLQASAGQLGSHVGCRTDGRLAVR
jgi:hypothetical protein